VDILCPNEMSKVSQNSPAHQSLGDLITVGDEDSLHCLGLRDNSVTPYNINEMPFVVPAAANIPVLLSSSTNRF
jgi:hypothetical protein